MSTTEPENKPSSFRAMLWTEHGPYILSLFMAAGGWLINHTVQELNAIPTMEYSIEYNASLGDDKRPIASSQARLARVTVTNLSPGETISGLQIELTDNDAAIACEQQQSVSLRAVKVIESHTPSVCGFTISAAPPGSSIAFEMPYADRVEPAIRFTRADAKGKYRLVESSFETFITRHQFAILYGAFACWGILILGLGRMRDR